MGRPTAQQRRAEEAAAVASQEEPGAAQRLADQEARIAELTAALEEARAAAAAPDAPAESGGQMSEVFGQLAEAIQGLTTQQASSNAKAFAPGESAESVMQSLEGTTTAGAVLEDGRIVEHSGKRIATVTFRSKGSNQNAIRKARHRLVNAAGDVSVSPGVHYQFLPHTDGGGEFTTDDEVVADFLRSREGFNREYVEVGNEPDRVPSPAPVLDLVMDAQINLDVAGLDELEQEEQASWKRPAVLEAIAAARRRVRKSQAEVGL